MIKIEQMNKELLYSEKYISEKEDTWDYQTSKDYVIAMIRGDLDTVGSLTGDLSCRSIVESLIRWELYHRLYRTIDMSIIPQKKSNHHSPRMRGEDSQPKAE